MIAPFGLVSGRVYGLCFFFFSLKLMIDVGGTSRPWAGGVREQAEKAMGSEQGSCVPQGSPLQPPPPVLGPGLSMMG